MNSKNNGVSLITCSFSGSKKYRFCEERNLYIKEFNVGHSAKRVIIVQFLSILGRGRTDISQCASVMTNFDNWGRFQISQYTSILTALTIVNPDRGWGRIDVSHFTVHVNPGPALTIVDPGGGGSVRPHYLLRSTGLPVAYL